MAVKKITTAVQKKLKNFSKPLDKSPNLLYNIRVVRETTLTKELQTADEIRQKEVLLWQR